MNNLDYARIVIQKGLFLQSLKILEKAKGTGKANQKFNFLAQVIALEKKLKTSYYPQYAEKTERTGT